MDFLFLGSEATAMNYEIFHGLSDEEKRAFILGHNPYAMPLGQADLALLEHECRMINQRPEACERLLHGIRGACEQCLLATGLKKG